MEFHYVCILSQMGDGDKLSDVIVLLNKRTNKNIVLAKTATKMSMMREESYILLG